MSLAATFCVLFLGAPLLVMAWSTVFSEDGFTLQAYGQLLAEPIDRLQMRNTLALGATSTVIALLLGGGHAFLTHRTDMPGAAWLAPLGAAPLAIPPIVVAMGFSDLGKTWGFSVSGFMICALLLGISYAPLVAVMTARGLRSVDGRAYEAVLLTRGRAPAERMLLRMVRPEIAAGCLFALVFVVSEHGVPEFLTVKGKTWHTYAEGVFARWTRRATGVSHADLVSPIVAAVPLLLIIAVALFFALRLRAHTDLRSVRPPLPRRSLGRLRIPALLLPLVYLGAGIGVPLVVLSRWAAGSTQVDTPMGFAQVRHNVQAAFSQAGTDLTTTIVVAAATAVLVLLIAMPIAFRAAGRWPVLQHLSVVPIAVPAILLGMGLVKVWNSPLVADWLYSWSGDFYGTAGLLTCGYAARFLPFGVLALTQSLQRQAASVGEAAQLSARTPLARFLRIRLPLLMPAGWSAMCLVFVLGLRELDLAVVLPAGNETVVRRLSNVVHFGGEDMGGALALMLLGVAVLVPLIVVLVTGRRLTSLS
ncbi:MAG: iron ABC transporter permease [Planctomycetes bacterium]|nr:iron ABC transporter permease [Planctomycetota bacterium]